MQQACKTNPMALFALVEKVKFNTTQGSADNNGHGLLRKSV